MSDNFERLSQLLPTLLVDTAYEQELLAASGAVGERLLVAGSQEAQPFSLLAMDEPLLAPDWAPLFPIDAEYGSILSIRAVNIDGEIERFHSAADFQRYCGGRLEELIACTVQLPIPLLERCPLRFLLLNGTTFQTLNKKAAGCTGCVIVAAADAGGFSEDYQTLCDWLTSERCVADRVSLILTQRAPRFNPALEIMAETMLKREKVAVFRCSLGRGSGLSPARALDHAVRDILDRCGDSVENGGIDGSVICACCARLEEKLRTALAETEADGEEAQRQEKLCRSAEKSFHAMAETDRYSLSDLLTQKENADIRTEVRAMFAALRVALPGLIDDAAARSDNPKEDLRQLTGDYLSDLMDKFLTDLLMEFSESHLIPRTQERFDQVIERFQRLSSELSMESFDGEIPVSLDLLKNEGVNIGDYRTAMAVVISRVITEGGKALVKLLAAVLAGEYMSPASFVTLTNVLNKAGETISSFMEQKVDSAMPLGLYTGSLKKAVLKKLDSAEQVLCDQLDKSVFPRLYSLLDEQFLQMSKDYENLLHRQGDRCVERERAAARKAEQIREQLRHVEELCPGAASEM